ncbi:hypothetical protein [Paenibacillus thalictri]|uniref:Uncharacterized protein n=1 Tax=Paenibacillus thalictri TaxID=2527873 RepID=A0A4Q9DKH5_9BACL|nr:hypothetical protein [Paenibacillus thalictri]TBL75291.1 hypothetical protein EYB31_23035 [Paenibacillus thalictri]
MNKPISKLNYETIAAVIKSNPYAKSKITTIHEAATETMKIIDKLAASCTILGKTLDAPLEELKESTRKLLQMSKPPVPGMKSELKHGTRPEPKPNHKTEFAPPASSNKTIPWFNIHNNDKK